jgi:hypothetical protein
LLHHYRFSRLSRLKASFETFLTDHLAIGDRRARRPFLGVSFIGQIGNVFVTIDEEVVLQDDLLGLTIGVLHDVDGLAFVDLTEIASKAIIAEMVKRNWACLYATRLDSATASPVT